MSIRARIFGEADGSPIVGAKKPKSASSPTGLHSIPIGREARTTDTRGEDRHRLGDEQVRITHDGRQREARLINLSGGGAMIEAGFEPMLWDRLDLHLGENGTIECAVKWLKGGRIGLEFAHETRLDCSAGEQATLLREVIARSFPDVEFDVVEELDDQGEERNDGENRRDRRHPLIWSGVIHHDYQSTPVRLRNISETGAMIECTAPLRAGSEPLLDLGEAGSVFATVSWVVGDSAGLRFHAPFDLTRLARSRPDVAPVKWERPGYLAPGEAADSPWDQEWGRMSLGELRQELEGYLKH